MATKKAILAEMEKRRPSYTQYRVVRNAKALTGKRRQRANETRERLLTELSTVQEEIASLAPHDTLRDNLLKQVQFVLDVEGDATALAALASAYQPYLRLCELVAERKRLKAEEEKTVGQFLNQVVLRRYEVQDVDSSSTGLAGGDTLEELFDAVCQLDPPEP